MRRIAAALGLLTIAAVAPPPRVDAQTPPWLGSGWNKRIELSLVAPPDTAISNVVLLVSGQNASPVFGTAKSDGADLRVTGPDGTTVLPYQKVGYNAASQTLELWFRAAAVGPASTKFYLYYGNANAADQSNPGATWSDFDAVYLFDNTPGGALPDQTGHGNSAGYVQGSWGPSQLVAGKIGRAWNYAGGRSVGVWNKQITAGAEWTVSAWVRLTGHSTDFLLQGNPCYFSLHVQASDVSWDTGQYKNDYCPELGWSIRTSQNVAINAWHQHTWTTDAVDSTLTYYYDGAYIPYNTQTNRDFPNVRETPNERWKCHPIGSTSEGVGIGSAMYPNHQDDMDGDVDQFTIRSWKVPAKYLAVEYANQNNPGGFWLAGAPQDRPSGVDPAHSMGRLKAGFSSPSGG